MKSSLFRKMKASAIVDCLCCCFCRPLLPLLLPLLATVAGYRCFLVILPYVTVNSPNRYGKFFGEESYGKTHDIGEELFFAVKTKIWSHYRTLNWKTADDRRDAREGRTMTLRGAHRTCWYSTGILLVPIQ